MVGLNIDSRCVDDVYIFRKVLYFLFDRGDVGVKVEVVGVSMLGLRIEFCKLF